MNLEQVTTSISKKTGFTKNDIKKMYNALIETFIDEINENSQEKNIQVSLPKLGKFTVNYVKPHMGYNPKKRERCPVNMNRRIYFSPYKQLKNKIQ